MTAYLKIYCSSVSDAKERLKILGRFFYLVRCVETPSFSSGEYIFRIDEEFETVYNKRMYEYRKFIGNI